MRVLVLLSVFIVYCVATFTKDAVIEEYIQNLTKLNNQLEQDLETLEKKYAEIKRSGVEKTRTRKDVCNASPVVFDARLSSNLFPLGLNQIIVYDNVITNTGSAYEQFSGIFRAPYRGLYQFIATMWSLDGHFIDYEMVKNGLNVCNGRTTTMNETMGICTAVLELDIGDHVWVRHKRTGGDYAQGLSYPSFVGHLIL